MILLTGATGYIGGRLLKKLETRGERVHCLARQPEFLRPKIAPGTKVVAGDVLDRTSLFIMTAAHAAKEAKSEGADLDIPYWRTLKTDGYLNEKSPGGAESHKALLEKEGFKVVIAGKRWRVDDYQTHLVDEL